MTHDKEEFHFRVPFSRPRHQVGYLFHNNQGQHHPWQNRSPHFLVDLSTCASPWKQHSKESWYKTQCLFFIRSKIIYCENSLLQVQTLLWKLNSMSHNFLHLAFGFFDELLSSSNRSNSTTLFQRSSYDGWFYVMHDPLLLVSCDTKLLLKKYAHGTAFISVWLEFFHHYDYS